MSTDHYVPRYVVFSTLLLLVPLRPKYPPQHPILEYPQPMFLPQCERPSFTPIQNNRQNYSSVYLKCLYFWIANWKTEDPAPNDNKPCEMFCNMVIFNGEELLAPRPTSKLEDHPVSAVRDCLFNIFAATLHIWRPFLHPPTEDAPCRGDRNPLIMV
jgi:hypothetical protein